MAVAKMEWGRTGVPHRNRGAKAGEGRLGCSWPRRRDGRSLLHPHHSPGRNQINRTGKRIDVRYRRGTRRFFVRLSGHRQWDGRRLIFRHPIRHRPCTSRRADPRPPGNRRHTRSGCPPMTAPDALTALPHPADGRAPLRCSTCGRVEPRSADTLGRLARGTWPECCGRVMRPAAEPEPELGEPVERRAGLRRRAKPGSRAEVRRGSLGMGPDLALGLVDVSEGGAQVRSAVRSSPASRFRSPCGRRAGCGRFA